MYRSIGAAVVLLLVAGPASADVGDDDLHIFGYMQAQWFSSTQIETEDRINSFSIQQLNLMLQRDIGDRWGAFVNIESVNSFSTSQNWGSINLEEAWVRWRHSPQFKLKLGLLIPKFNRFNEIKNRMPVHPYIIRPFVYESSFAQNLAIEEYVPRRAYAQAYGFIPATVKFDYAAYVGNSPGINDNPNAGNTGIDTTDAFMVGGRVGVRVREFQLGVSGTWEEVNFLVGLEDTLGGPPDRFNDVPRMRLGVDFSFELEGVALEFEYINVHYDEDAPEINIDKHFWYATLGYQVNDRWFAFVSYWKAVEYFNDLIQAEKGHLQIPNFGLTYRLNDRITFKGHYGEGRAKTDVPGVSEEEDFRYLSFAASVFF